jgi:N-acetylglutamate synthase-like GNAT family acetyltransferase
MRVIDRGDSWYGASFNVNPTIQGSRVGSELLKKVIADMGSEKPFVADVYAKNPMLQNYLDTFGFQITKTTEDYHGTGTTVHQITWTKPE